MFKKIFGQDRLFLHLRRLIDEKRADGSYLFAGLKGVGKWAYGFLFAAAYCCTGEGEKPCGSCRSCKAIVNFKHPDIQFLFPFPNLEPSKKQVTVFQFSDPSSGAKFSMQTAEEIERFFSEKHDDPFRIVRFHGRANIPVDVVRDLRKFLSRRPLWGGKRAVVISDVENMAPRCADLFLKAIEEPPPNTSMVLTSSVPEKLPATVLSRCRFFSLQSPDGESVKGYLRSHFKKDEYNEHFICRASRFSPGMARAFVEENIVDLRDGILGMLKSAAPSGRGRYIDGSFSKYTPDFNVVNGGIDAVAVLTWILRDIIVMHNRGDVDDIINCDRAETIAGLAGRLPADRAEYFLQQIGDVRIACELSNVMPMTAFRRLLALMKENLASEALA